ncbi:hypothetical protein [Rathayibacter toxicus]
MLSAVAELRVIPARVGRLLVVGGDLLAERTIPARAGNTPS